MKTITINEFEYPTYATVEDADKYFSAKFGSTWGDIEQSDKEKLLVTATREIEKAEFQFCKVDINQDLAFPRMPRFNCYDVIINPEKELIECCCEIANAINNLSFAESITTPGIDKIKSMSIGDTSITYKDGAEIEVDAFSATASPIIKKYLHRWLKGNIKIIL